MCGAGCRHCPATAEPARAAYNPQNKLGKECLLGKVLIRAYPGFRPPYFSHRQKVSLVIYFPLQSLGRNSIFQQRLIPARGDVFPQDPAGLAGVTPPWAPWGEEDESHGGAVQGDV